MINFKTVKKRFVHARLYVFMVGFLWNPMIFGQSVGVNFGIFNSPNQGTLIQSIGQPFAVFERMEKSGNQNKPVHLNQGHILPGDNYSVTKSAELALKFFPNPVEDMLQVNVEKQGIIKSIDVFDVNGRLVFREIFQNQSAFQSISLGSFSPGIYMIQVIDHHGIKGVGKVTKLSHSN
jgi:hypothetical protein